MKKILILTTLLLFALSSVAFGASARWLALGGEQRFLIDTSNYANYPGRMLQFADAVWIIPNHPSAPDHVMSGLLVKKGDMAWALHYNMPGTLGFGALRSGLAGSGNSTLTDLSTQIRPFPDVFLAMKMGDMTVGGRVVLGLASSEPVKDKTASAMSVDVAAGVTMAAGPGDVDLGVRVSIAGFSDDSTPKKTESTGGFAVAVDGRLMMSQSEGKTLVPVFSGAFGSDVTVKDREDEVSYVTGDVGVGMMSKSKSMLVAGVLLGFGSVTSKPTSGDVSTTTLTVTYLGGYEKPITTWLTGRGGARGTLSLVSGDNWPANGKSASFSYGFGFRTAYKKVLLDVLLDNAFLNRGPYIVTGSGDSWSSNVCLTYMFD